MAKPIRLSKKQCEDDIEKKFANIIQQGLSSTLQALKSQLNYKSLPGNRFCWREGIGLHLQFCNWTSWQVPNMSSSHNIAKELSIRSQS